eukprot:1139617-Pelagomonas_calceolata.AAC.8
MHTPALGVKNIKAGCSLQHSWSRMSKWPISLSRMHCCHPMLGAATHVCSKVATTQAVWHCRHVNMVWGFMCFIPESSKQGVGTFSQLLQVHAPSLGAGATRSQSCNASSGQSLQALDSWLASASSHCFTHRLNGMNE